MEGKSLYIRLRLPPEVAEAVLAEARRRGLKPTTLVRMWVFEKAEEVRQKQAVVVTSG